MTEISLCVIKVHATEAWVLAFFFRDLEQHCALQYVSVFSITLAMKKCLVSHTKSEVNSVRRIWGCDTGGYEEFYLRDIIPCSPLKVDRRFGGTYRLHPCLPPAFMLAYSSTLKLEAACSSETSVDFQWTIWHYIPEDTTLHDLDISKTSSRK
jgi:hypothetical protein